MEKTLPPPSDQIVEPDSHAAHFWPLPGQPSVAPLSSVGDCHGLQYISMVPAKTSKPDLVFWHPNHHPQVARVVDCHICGDNINPNYGHQEKVAYYDDPRSA